MTRHPGEQLSAYFDDELDAAARHAVESHLESCAACVGFLEDLASLRTAALDMPEAPFGYFEALPARVGARIAPARIRAVRRPAVWLGAAAAGLLLAVLTPRLLQETPAPMAAPAARQEPPTTVPPQAVGDDASVPRSEAVPAAPESRREAAVSRPPAAVQSQESEERPLAAERHHDAAAKPDARAQTDPASAMDFAAPPADPSAFGEAASAVSDSAAEAGKAAAPTPPALPGAPQTHATGAGAAGSAPGAGPAPPAKLQELKAERQRARSVARPALRGGTDAERWAVLELGARTWRLGRDPSDLAQLRADVAAYLLTADADATARAKKLLREAESLVP